MRHLQEEDADLRFIDKVLAAKEAQYGAQPLVSKTSGWYTANISAAEEKLLANWAALQAREASASTGNGGKRYDVNEEARQEQRLLHGGDPNKQYPLPICVTKEPVKGKREVNADSFRKYQENTPPEAKPKGSTMPTVTPSPNSPTFPTPYPPSHPDKEPNKPQRRYDVNEEAQREQRALEGMSERKRLRFHSIDDAAMAWAEQNAGLGKDKERCAMIYKYTDEYGNEQYSFGKTREGMKNNVILPFFWSYFAEAVPESERVGFIHTHPEPPEGYTSVNASDADKLTLYFPGIETVFVVPYERYSQPKENETYHAYPKGEKDYWK